MILEVAKWKYREDNPSRHRVPRGFSDGISLKLTGVEEGSSIPVISLVVGAAQQLARLTKDTRRKLVLASSTKHYPSFGSGSLLLNVRNRIKEGRGNHRQDIWPGKEHHHLLGWCEGLRV